jgi:uncharacterized membrane protein
VTRNRDPGSPQWLPIYQHGSNVRFSARAANLERPDNPWSKPRIVYVQHASDPIAWWNTALLFRKPEWLREKRGYDVLPSVAWIPLVTFLQVSADMALAVDVPDGTDTATSKTSPTPGRRSCNRRDGQRTRPTGCVRCYMLTSKPLAAVITYQSSSTAADLATQPANSGTRPGGST